MKTDLASLKSIKKEIIRLTDADELKKELNRLAAEIRKFDLSTAIPAAQRTRLEKRYRELKKTLVELQKRVDSSFAKVSSFVRKAANQTGRATAKASTSAKKTSRKTAGKTTSRKKVAKKTSKRSRS
jgi:hypothetical protein